MQDTNLQLEASIQFNEHRVEDTYEGRSQIPGNERYQNRKGGRTMPIFNRMEGGLVSHGKGKYSVEFFIDYEIDIWYVDSKRNEEWRHARDLRRSYIKSINLLRAIEEYSRWGGGCSKSIAEALIRYGESTAESRMISSQVRSTLTRDLPFPGFIYDDIISAGVDKILGDSGGAGIPRRQEWRY